MSLTQSQRQAVHTKDRHHPWHARGQQRQGIKGALTDPERTRARLQRGGVEIPLGTRKVIMPLPFRDLLFGPHGTTVEIHQAPLWRRVRKDHTTTPPIPSGMRPGAWRGIAHTQLLRQR